MKLIACSTCHAQYDISEMAPESAFDCRCGETLHAITLKTADSLICRCSACGAVAKSEEDLCDYCGAEIIQMIDRGSLICPECYAQNLDDARFCVGCGVGFDPISPKSARSDLRCPCCECWMTSRDVGGLEISECPKCFGLWAPENRLASLVERATAVARDQANAGEATTPRVDGANPAEAPVEYRRCPVCDALMSRKNFQKRSGVIVDRCHQHGTWLDANELERIAGFVLSGRAAKAAETETELEAARERASTGGASTRVQNSWADGYSAHAGFGHHQTSFAVRTIFDLLTGFLH